jgi:hypothetical protein
MSDVDTSPRYHAIGFGLDFRQHILAAAGNAHLPPTAAQLAHYLEPYARRGTHHHGTAAFFLTFHLLISMLLLPKDNAF